MIFYVRLQRKPAWQRKEVVENQMTKKQFIERFDALIPNPSRKPTLGWHQFTKEYYRGIRGTPGG